MYEKWKAPRFLLSRNQQKQKVRKTIEYTRLLAVGSFTGYISERAYIHRYHRIGKYR